LLLDESITPGCASRCDASLEIFSDLKVFN
jgi:hypothetical protein